MVNHLADDLRCLDEVLGKRDDRRFEVIGLHVRRSSVAVAKGFDEHVLGGVVDATRPVEPQVARFIPGRLGELLRDVDPVVRVFGQNMELGGDEDHGPMIGPDCPPKTRAGVRQAEAAQRNARATAKNNPNRYRNQHLNGQGHRQLWAGRGVVRQTQRVSIRLTRPSSAELLLLAQAATSDSLTYDTVGISAMAEPPSGYRLDRWSISLGKGEHAFDRAVEALRHWRVHEGAGLVVYAGGLPTVDSVVAMAAPLPVGWVEVVCRVVAVIDEPDRFGFTYGTLSVHPEQGEESFTVIRASDGSTDFRIVAASRPRHVLARALPPVARRLQRAAINRYLAAMKSAIDG